MGKRAMNKAINGVRELPWLLCDACGGVSEQGNEKSGENKNKRALRAMPSRDNANK